MRSLPTLCAALALAVVPACKKKEAPGTPSQPAPVPSPSAPSAPSAPSRATGAATADAPRPASAAKSNIPAVIPLGPAKAHGERWLVVLSSSKDAGVSPPGLEVLRQHPELPLAPARLSSTELRGLQPCYEIVVANAFVTRAEADALAAKLRALRVAHYVKNAGRFVGKQPAVEAYCRSEKAPKQPSRCGGLHWVEQREGRSYLALGLDAAVRERLPAAGAPKLVVPPEPADGTTPPPKTFATWSAPLGAETLGAYAVGQKYALYAAGASKKVGTCTLRRFVWLTRGTPHFGYVQSAREPGGEPKTPGCGAPEPFAQLDCGAARGEVAELEGKTSARPFALGAPEKDGSLLAAAAGALRKAPAYVAAKARAEADAKKLGAPLQEQVTLRALERGERAHWLVEVVLQTGEGMTECGRDDVRVGLVAIAEKTEDGVGALVAGPRELPAGQLRGAFDLRGDGKLQLLFSTIPDVRRLLEAESLAPLCESAVPFCDCGC